MNDRPVIDAEFEVIAEPDPPALAPSPFWDWVARHREGIGEVFEFSVYLSLFIFMAVVGPKAHAWLTDKFLNGFF